MAETEEQEPPVQTEDPAKTEDAGFFMTDVADDGSTQMGDTQADFGMATTGEGGVFRISGMGSASSARPFRNEALSARKVQLVKEAEMRAEHQLQAQRTMLELASELDQSSIRRQELEAMIVKEQRLSAILREELAGWQPKLDKALAEIDHWKQRTMNKEIECSLFERPFFPFLMWWACEYRPLGEHRSAVSGVTIDDEESHKVDRITLRAMMKSWRAQSSGSTERKRVAAEHEEVVKTLKSQITAEREEHAKLLAAEKKVVKDLEENLVVEKDKLASAERRIRTLENEKIALMDKQEAMEIRHKAEVDELRRQLAEVPGMLAAKDAEIERHLALLKDAEERVLSAQADSSNEIERLKARILQLSEELKKSLTMAKHMKESATKAKREATGCISPEKFAFLIMELEELREKMHHVGTTKEPDRGLIDKMKLQMDQSRRRMELERQFLPLLHKVQGPVGPQSKMIKGQKKIGGVIAQLDPNSVDRMRQSRSAGAIDMSGQGGEAQRAMGSTTGFAGFGGGAPLRGV
eukprot:TRINITY_DN105367_c0_g1_i1.p1 TRINITY_DN105367_c0_g1~~TRINITY_DN105367_c0_g1_i1.p1  ORF type:complete len:525 (-),score=143.15 TRINITY_DN105367_c0_g1_i1:52-1626(-)